jgi:ACS family tartrate transporter-like MFS transporter
MSGFIDRSNVGCGPPEPDLSSPPFTGCGSIFFLVYAFQIPAVLLARLGAHQVIFCVMLVWAWSRHERLHARPQFSALRFALGVAEGGFTPSMIFYLTLWFPPAYRGRLIATFCSAIPIAGIISGPLSGLILGMDGIAQLHGWQWLFLIQGLPAVLLAFVVLASLPDGPAQAEWLDTAERSAIAAGLAPGRMRRNAACAQRCAIRA